MSERGIGYYISRKIRGLRYFLDPDFKTKDLLEVKDQTTWHPTDTAMEIASKLEDAMSATEDHPVIEQLGGPEGAIKLTKALQKFATDRVADSDALRELLVAHGLRALKYVNEHETDTEAGTYSIAIADKSIITAAVGLEVSPMVGTADQWGSPFERQMLDELLLKKRETNAHPVTTALRDWFADHLGRAMSQTMPMSLRAKMYSIGGYMFKAMDHNTERTGGALADAWNRANLDDMEPAEQKAWAVDELARFASEKNLDLSGRRGKEVFEAALNGGKDERDNAILEVLNMAALYASAEVKEKDGSITMDLEAIEGAVELVRAGFALTNPSTVHLAMSLIMPVNEGKTQDTEVVVYDEREVPSLAAIGDDHEYGRKVLERLKQKEVAPFDVESLDDFANKGAHNLVALWKSVPAAELKEARRWYEGARNIVDRLYRDVKAYPNMGGVREENVAAVIAILSPGADWSHNVEQARRLVQIVARRPGFSAAYSPEVTARLEQYAVQAEKPLRRRRRGPGTRRKPRTSPQRAGPPWTRRLAGGPCKGSWMMRRTPSSASDLAWMRRTPSTCASVSGARPRCWCGP